MFRRFNSEMHCALFVGSVFVFFFVSSVFTVANANPLQWDDSPDDENPLTLQPYGPDSTFNPDELMGIPPERQEPGAGGPSEWEAPAAGEVDPQPGWPGVWNPISTFFQTLIDFVRSLGSLA